MGGLTGSWLLTSGRWGVNRNVVEGFNWRIVKGFNHRYISLDWSHGFKTKKLYNTLYIMNPGVVKVMAYISFCGGIL